MKKQEVAKEWMVKELCLSCQDCKYFLRHYIRSDNFPGQINGFTPICKGHCIALDKRGTASVGAGDPACSYFELRS